MAISTRNRSFPPVVLISRYFFDERTVRILSLTGKTNLSIFSSSSGFPSSRVIFALKKRFPAGSARFTIKGSRLNTGPTVNCAGCSFCACSPLVSVFVFSGAGSFFPKDEEPPPGQKHEQQKTGDNDDDQCFGSASPARFLGLFCIVFQFIRPSLSPYSLGPSSFTLRA